MNKTIKILHLEDTFNDSELIRSIIDSGNIDHEYFLTDNEPDFLALLQTHPIDIILSDYSLPDYNGNEALKVARESYPHISFIFVSGKIGEDAAINAMLNGATDYVLKNKLERLLPAINRAVYEQQLAHKNMLAEIALRQSEASLKKAQKIAKLGSWYRPIVGQATWSDEMFRIFGLTPGTIPPDFETFILFLHPEDQPLMRVWFNACFAGEKPGLFEFRCVLPDRNIHYISGFGEMLYDTNNNPVALTGIAQDITERKLAEIHLKEKNRQIEVQNEKYVLINRELAFQNEEKEKRAAELFVANTELMFQNEEKVKRATELTLAKEKAEESDQLKTAFLHNMSHEIRTPLNAIIGFSAMLNDEGLSRADIGEYTAIINLSGKRLIEIVNNILDISKIQTRQIVIEQESVQINALFSDLFSAFSPVASARNISLAYLSGEDLFQTVTSDKSKLHQILSNLLNNAVKFTKTGHIRYGYEIREQHVQFYVNDTGIGIPVHLHQSIFGRFIQADQSMSKDYEGAGLGLAISSGLVEMLGGKIWVESEVDKGSTFYFTIPFPSVSHT